MTFRIFFFNWSRVKPVACNLINFSHISCHTSKRIFRFSAGDRFSNFYRPQTKLREGNVLTPVSHSVHRGMGCLALGLGVYTSLVTPPDTPGTHTPLVSPPRHTPLDTHPRHTLPLPPRHTPPGHAPLDTPSLRSTNGWYASYWNAFLSHGIFSRANSKGRSDISSHEGVCGSAWLVVCRQLKCFSDFQNFI